jgi:hypothetical protein
MLAQLRGWCRWLADVLRLSDATMRSGAVHLSFSAGWNCQALLLIRV